MNSIHFKQIGNFGLITLEDEGKFNPQSLEQFDKAIDQCLSSEKAQALILTGTGKNFSQGLDLDCVERMENNTAREFGEACMAVLARLLIFPIPVVAAVNGHAFGFGAMLVLASDYSVMREDRGFFCLPEIDLGMDLIPSMNALVKQKLSGRVLRDLLLTGQRICGREAVKLSIIDAYAAEDQILTIARTLPLSMIGKDKAAMVKLKTGINGAILRYCSKARAT